MHVFSQKGTGQSSILTENWSTLSLDGQKTTSPKETALCEESEDAATTVTMSLLLNAHSHKIHICAVTAYFVVQWNAFELYLYFFFFYPYVNAGNRKQDPNSKTEK